VCAFGWKALASGRPNSRTSPRGFLGPWRVSRGRKLPRHRHRTTVTRRSARQATLFIEPAKCDLNVRLPDSGHRGTSHLCRQLRTFWRPANTIQAAPQKAPWLSAGAHLESNGVDIRSLSPGGGAAFGRSQSRGFRDCYWSAAQLGSKMNAFVFQVICVCAVRRFLLLADFVAKGIAAKPARARCGA
jgi:hypothetical protein